MRLLEHPILAVFAAVDLLSTEDPNPRENLAQFANRFAHPGNDKDQQIIISYQTVKDALDVVSNVKEKEKNKKHQETEDMKAMKEEH